MADWTGLQQHLPLALTDLPAFQQMASQRPDLQRDWQLVRALFGVHPTVPPMGIDPAQLLPRAHEDAALEFGLDADDIPGLLGLLALAWEQHQRQAVLPEVMEQPKYQPKKTRGRPKGKGKAKAATETPDESPPPTVSPDDLFTVEEMELLELGRFSTGIFEYHTNLHDRQAEAQWFCDRIDEVRKVFEEPMTKALGRQALLNELQLRRIEDKLAAMDPTSDRYAELQEVKQSTEKAYGAQWEQIEKMMPGIVATASRKTQLQNFASLVQCYRDWCADPANRPRDGVFTDDEMQVLFRVSVQQPDPVYRFGWVAAVNEARLGIGDPRWKRQMTERQCKILDTAAAYAIKVLTAKYGGKKPDLMRDDAAGEYDEIYTRTDGEMTDPDWEAMRVTEAEEEAAEAVAILDPVVPKTEESI